MIISKNTAIAVNIHNNTNMGIPIELIKDGYYTNVKNLDGSLLRIDKRSSSVFASKNYIQTYNCDKEQNVESKLKLILIDDTVLTTESEREVTVK